MQMGTSRWELSNIPETPAWVPWEENHIEGVCVTGIGTEFFSQVKEIYRMDRNSHILCKPFMKYCKNPSLFTKLDEVCKKSYEEGRLNLLDGILYQRIKHKCAMTLKEKVLINTILHYCHNSVAYGHFSEGRTLEMVKNCSWFPNWRKDVAEYFQTFDRCQIETEPQARDLELLFKYKNQNPNGK
ncbi:hypothetical protein O181_048521 [Austropuccinia psidii MF-1]|uniref:Integrase zinc-binding domain-containing protein n=1 Tax=Austropuccinia psidii MF-1 TaxID=1389203 RepID=A0A9Q3DY61_9BASI|nr:hypothetical protein [Austropuccinia psidii MF-1]